LFLRLKLFAFNLNLRRYTKAGAASAAGAAAALANLDVNPPSDRTNQTEDPRVLFFRALGPELVRRKVVEGDRAAQFSRGCILMVEARAADAGLSGMRSPKAQVGLTLNTSVLGEGGTTQFCPR